MASVIDTMIKQQFLSIEKNIDLQNQPGKSL